MFSGNTKLFSDIESLFLIILRGSLLIPNTTGTLRANNTVEINGVHVRSSVSHSCALAAVVRCMRRLLKRNRTHDRDLTPAIAPVNTKPSVIPPSTAQDRRRIQA